MSEADVLTQAPDVGGPQQPLLEVQQMSKHFPVRGGFVGKAGVVRSEAEDTPYPRYAFRIVERAGDWVIQ